MRFSNRRGVGVVAGILVLVTTSVLYVQDKSKQNSVDSVASKKFEADRGPGMATPIDIEKAAKRGLVPIADRQYAKSVKDRALASRAGKRTSSVESNTGANTSAAKISAQPMTNNIAKPETPKRVGFIYPRTYSMQKDGGVTSVAMEPVSKGVLYQQRLRIARGEVLFERATPKRKGLPLTPSQHSGIH